MGFIGLRTVISIPISLQCQGDDGRAHDTTTHQTSSDFVLPPTSSPCESLAELTEGEARYLVRPLLEHEHDLPNNYLPSQPK